MTLTIMISTEDGTIAASDLLISKKSRSQTFFPPTSPIGFQYNEENSYRPTRVEQKLTRLADNVLICWAGSTLQARAMARHLKSGISGNWWTKDQIRHCINKFPVGDDSELEGFVLLTDKDMVGSFSINCWPYELEGIKEAYCLGSGRPSFHQWAEAQSIAGNADTMGSLPRALMFLGPSLILQAEYGFGLEEAWGGGFQAAYRFADGWKFVDRILVRLWEGVFSQNQVYSRIARIIYLYYENDDLFISTDAMDGLPAVYTLARTIFAPLVHVHPSEKEQIPEWSIDVIAEDRKVVWCTVKKGVDEGTKMYVGKHRLSSRIPHETYKRIFAHFRMATGRPPKDDVT